MTIDRSRTTAVLAALRAQGQPVSRRQVLRAAMGLAAASLFAPLVDAADAPKRARFEAYPFALGVGSGYPTPTGVTLWTRLAPQPLQPLGGLDGENIDVDWQIAEDEKFARVVGEGRVRANIESAYAAHVDVEGLRPGRWYWYRFRAGDEISPVGRTRTAVAAGEAIDRLRLGLGSCQHYEQGYYGAHRHLCDENLDLMLFVGDYIYESTWGDDLVRRHARAETYTIDDYRVRYAQTHADPDLQRSHAAMPWALVWDDHEVDNDWAGDQSEHLDPDFLTRRAAAFRAFFEHQPLPRRMRPRGADMRIYDTLTFGDLARIHLLDDRQYRSPQACPDPYKGGGSTDVFADACADLNRADRTLLGAEQEAWLERQIASSSARWNVIAQQTMLAPFDADPSTRIRSWTDGWDGYPSARERLLAVLRKHAPRNAVVLGGDIHATTVSDVHARPYDEKSPIVAAEFCGTSITSQGWPAGSFDERLRINPHVKYAVGHERGYLTVALDAKQCEVAVRSIDSEKHRDTTIRTAARFTVAEGSNRIERA